MANPLSRFQFRLGEGDRERLQLHAERLALEMSVVVQLSVHEKLIRLDEELAFERAQKDAAKRSRRVGQMGTLPGGTGSAGMPIVSPSTGAPPPTPFHESEPKVLEKLDRSFRSYFEYVEAADGPIARSMRIDRVLDDMRTRATDAEANLAFVEFQDKLAQRARLLAPTDLKKLPDDVPVSGDFEED